MKGFITVTEAAKIKKLSTGHIRQLCIEGKLEGVQKLGRNWAIPIASIENYTPGLKGFAAYWANKKAEYENLKNTIKTLSK